MKILYLISEDINNETGVVLKVKQQVKEWEKNNINVNVFSLNSLTLYDENFSVIDKKKPSKINGKLGTLLNLYVNSYKSINLLQKYDFDIVYCRYFLFTPFLKRFFQKNIVIMEINSDDTQEYKLNSKYTYLYNKLTRNLLLKNINAYVCVSNELKNKFIKYKKLIKVIANGIDVSSCTIEIQNHDNNVPIFVFIGSPNQPWHGLDKIEKLGEYFQDYQFFIIGTKKKDKKNIKYFGYLTNDKAVEIMKKCDIGIGSLALHRNHLNEASPLKTRQYLACGLPIIYAYEDTDIKDDVEFVLKLENRENNLDYEKIKNFVDKIFNDKTINRQARTFAEKILDYSIKEKKRLKFFEEVYKNAKK